MKNIKISLIKLIIFIGSKTFLGRGFLRKQLIKLLEKILNTIKFDKSKPLFKTKFHGFKIYFYADNKTGLKLYFQRNENKELNFIKKNIENNSWFIDVGSNIGLYSLNIANLNSKNVNIKILSIEPNPVSFDRLKKNYKLLKTENKFAKNKIYLNNYAIGDKNSYGFIDNSVNHENVKILKNINFIKKNHLKVKITNINYLINKNKIKKIGCLKIDTEGAEKSILTSFFNKVDTKKYPKFLIIEHNNDPNFSKLDKLILIKGYEMIFTTNSNAIYRRSNEKS